MISRKHATFALALHRALAPDGMRDTCWSPCSVASALCLVAELASGRTRDELVAVLTGQRADDLRMAIRLLALAVKGYQSNGDGAPPVALVTTLWIDEKLGQHEGGDHGVPESLGGHVRAAPLQAASEQARMMINGAVAESTSGLISELIPPGGMPSDGGAALVNALRLRTSWYSPFSAENTAPKPFHAPTGTRDVPTMELTAGMSYAAQDGWQVVELSASDGVDAVVLLPDKDLATAEAALHPDTLIELLTAARVRQVRLFLPRFRVAARAELTESLRKLGVKGLFDPRVGVNLIGPDPVVVTKIFHEAVLNIDESGIEGAAATAALMSPIGDDYDPDEPVVVSVDRPFMLLVRHRRTGTLFFMARVSEP